jgi:hypothetical protein
MNMKGKIRAVMPQAPVRGRSRTITPRLFPGSTHETVAARGAQVACRDGGRHTDGNEKAIRRETR